MFIIGKDSICLEMPVDPDRYRVSIKIQNIYTKNILSKSIQSFFQCKLNDTLKQSYIIKTLRLWRDCLLLSST